MAIVDQQGRLFGRLNLLDAAVLVLLAGLIPIGYAAYVLFREQPPLVTEVSPNRVSQAPEVRVTIKGKNFRPYMRVSAGNHQAVEFLFRSTTEAEVPFAGLPPGDYDLVLYDQAQERFRLPKALSVTPGPLPATQLIVVGAFGNLDAEKVKAFVPGLPLQPVGELLRVGTPAPDLTKVFSGIAQVGVSLPNALRLPAVVRLSCGVRALHGRPDCVVRDAAVAPAVLVVLPTPVGDVPFQIEQVLSTEPIQPTAIRVKFGGHLATLGLITEGDADRAGTANDLAAGAVVTAIGPLLRHSETSAERDVTLRADLQASPEGWLYDSAPIRAGSPFAMRTPRYVLHGTVIDLPAPPAGHQMR
jgi:hypothetical protein